MSAAVKRLSSDMSGADTTPRRPARSARDPGSIGGSSSARTLFEDVDQTPKRGLGLPTPPNSETTGSGSGSIGRVEARSSQLIDSDSAVTPHGSLSRVAGQTLSTRSPAMGSNAGDASSTEGRFSTLGRRRAAEALAGSNSSAEQTRAERAASTSMQRIGSSSTLRSETTASASLSNSRAERTKAERPRTSARHEQEVTDLRASSRAGRRPEEDDYLSGSKGTLRSAGGVLTSPRRRERNQTITHNTGDSTATDTSGTEGAGSSASRRRRKKSSNSLGKKSVPSRRGSRSSPGPEWEGADADDYRRHASTSSRASAHDRSTKAFPSEKRPSPHRRPTLPPDFREFEGRSRYRSDSIDANDSEGETTLEADLTVDGERRWGAAQPRRRFASDASTSEIPQFDYGGRGGTFESRLSVDSGAAARHLHTRGSAGDILSKLNGAWDPISSPSEEARIRKASLASRSSGNASDRLSSRSRASGRASRGDVFDDTSVASRESPPGNPSYLSENVRMLEERMAALEAPLRPSDSVSARGAGSTASSVVSRAQPRTVQSQRTFDLIGDGAYSARPSTEPRPQRSERSLAQDRSKLPSSQTVPSRIGASSELRSSQRGPMTPETFSASRAVSRLQTSALPESGRFTTSDQGSHLSGGSGIGADSLPHIQVLLSSLGMFERYFGSSGGSQPSTPSSGQGGPAGADSLELVGNLQQVSHTCRFINEGLRKLQHSVIQIRVDEQLSSDTTANGRLAEQLHRIDLELTSILRQSDSGIRALTNGLIGFARVEKERDRMRRLASDNGSVGRPGSRLQSLHYSPQRDQPRRAATQAYDDDVPRRSSDFRSVSKKQEIGGDVLSFGHGRPSSDHSGHIDGMTSNEAPSIPQSPHSPAVQRNGDAEARLSPVTVTSTSQSQLRSPYGHHTRSASEAITLRRGKISNTSDATARPSERSKPMPTLSPRRTEAAKVTPAVAYANYDEDDHELGAAQAAVERLSIDGGSHNLPPINTASLRKRAREYVTEPHELDRPHSVAARRNTVGSSDGNAQPTEAPARPPRRDTGRRSFTSNRDSISHDEPLGATFSRASMRSSNTSISPVVSKRDSTGIFSRILSRSVGQSAGKRASQVLSGEEISGVGSAVGSRRSSRDFGA